MAWLNQSPSNCRSSSFSSGFLVRQFSIAAARAYDQYGHVRVPHRFLTIKNLGHGHIDFRLADLSVRTCHLRYYFMISFFI